MEEDSEEQQTEHNREEINTYEAKLHAKYLLSATNFLKEIPSNALRCHWNTLLADIMQMKKIALSKRKTCDRDVCEYCLTPWKNGLYRIKVLPKQKRGKKLRKMIRREGKQKELSKYQRSLFGVLHWGQMVDVKCQICKKSSKFNISKMKPDTADKPPPVVNPEESISRKRKKRRKKKIRSSAPFVPLEIHNKKANNACIKQRNKIENIDDGEVVIIDEIHESNQKTDVKSVKRKLDHDILPPVKRKSKKIEGKEDVFPVKPLANASLHKSSKESGRYNKRYGFMALDDYKPQTKVRNSRLLNMNQGNQNKYNKKQIASSTQGKNEKMAKSLRRWKKLIADEEENPVKTASLQDFLSSL